MANIFTFFDYRKLLLDILAERQKEKPSLSSRNLALRTGIDPSYFAKVLKGTRNLTPEQTLKIADILGFDRIQTEYFEILVRFNQTRGHEAKRLCLATISLSNSLLVKRRNIMGFKKRMIICKNTLSRRCSKKAEYPLFDL
jgi:uncharacterized protein (TIGR02147 family)